MTTTLPFIPGSKTSYAASKAAVPKTAQDRRTICAFIAAQGAKGATDAEIAEGCPSVNSNAIRVRRGELRDKHFITAEAGERRDTGTGCYATVWHIRKLGLFALGLPASEWGIE